MKKTYSEMCRFSTFEERYRYLELKGKVGKETFGRTRFMNQSFYQSPRWQQIRAQVILRDNGCDLAMPGYSVGKRCVVHHINPITEEDILNDADCLYDMENLVTVRFDTHNAIHYGDPALMRIALIQDRKPNDMIPWR